jgi:3-oxoacid CoA-transferase subunit A
MNIFIVGDLHGSYLPVENFYCNHIENTPKELEENWLICLGDFGALYYMDRRDHHFKKDLGKYPFKYFVIRGNHEQRASDVAFLDAYVGWEEVECFGNTCLRQTAYPNIYYAKDEGGIYNIDGRKTLVIPGAYSVDKYYRLSRGWSWFAEEQLSNIELENLLKEAAGQHYQLILSHTCPFSYRPTDLFLPMVDQSTVDNRMEHWMDHLKEQLSFNIWCWGHYHADRIEAPHCEMFYTEVEHLEDVEARWHRYDETGELDWWIPKSPDFEKRKGI